MTKLLLSLVVMVMPFILSAQLLDTSVVFYENFDGSTIKMMTSTLFNESTGNWRLDSTLQVTSPASYHSRSYPTQGLSACWTQAIEVDRSYPYVFLQFNQICKINNNDMSLIYYQVSTGVTSFGDIQWGSWMPLNFSQTSCTSYYYGAGTGISDGNVSQNWYTDWAPNNNSATPNNNWWKTELLDLSQYVVGTDNQYFRIRFGTNHASGTGSGTDVCAGWYIDELKVIYSNTELVPPTITLTNPTYIGNVNNFTGPYVISAALQDNDTINVNSIRCWYETTDGDFDTLPTNIVNNQYVSCYNKVDCNWTIPMQCYGTTVTYHIYVEDTHGSGTVIEKSFTPRTTLSLQHDNAKMESFQDLPVYPEHMETGVSYPVKVVFRNKGKIEDDDPNHMTSAVFGWSVNGVNKPNYTWNGDLCLDYTDTIVVGNHVALRDSNKIKVWIISRNNVSPLVDFADDTIYYDGYACDSALSGTYTLGGPNADFPTVRFMKERFHRCGLDGPVTINMNAGTYTGFDFDDQYPGLSEVNTITFQAAPGVSRNAVVIQNDGNNPPVKFTEMAYITIRNVTIRNSNVGRCVDFVGKASHDITIDNCDLQATNSTSTPYYNSSAIGRVTAPQTATGGTGDYNLSFTNNIVNNANFGVYFVGGSNAAYKETGFIVNGNTINSTVAGIYATQAKGWSIDANKITQMATASDMDFVGVTVLNSADFQSVSRNSILMNERGGTGISFNTYANSNNVTDIVSVANNEIINKATVTGRYNIMVQASKQLNLYHNSSYIYSLVDITQSAPLYITGTASSTKDINVYNNIFYNASTSAENKNYAIYLNYSSASAMANTVKLNYNEYYSAGNSLGWFIAPRNNFAEWQNALASRGEDTLSVNIPIQFVSPSDSLVPSMYEGLECVPVSGVTTDIRGMARYTTITFMGCYTRAIPATDMAMIELTSPVLGNECPADHYPIKVMVKNTGSANLNFATKPTTIYYTIGTTTGAMTVTTGSIAPLQSKEVTVIANFPVSINTVYNYVFNIHVNGDSNTQNDSLAGSFEIQAAFPYYEEVFSTSDLYPSWRFEQISTTGAGNWTVELGAGTNPDIAPNYGLGRLFFNSKQFANNTESRAIMPVTILQGSTTPILEYWFAHDNYGSSNTEGVTVKISTDGGATYTAVNSVNSAGASSTLVKRYNSAYTTPGWEKYMVDLAGYSNESCIYIAFDAKSNAKNNINIDRVVVRNFYNTDLAVNDIWALGANPTQYEVSPKIYANISNEGRDQQSNFKVMLEITGANTYRDTITVPALASRSSMVVAFEGAHLNNPGDNVVRIYCGSDQNNDNNQHLWQMTTTPSEIGYANDSVVNGQHSVYHSIATGGANHIAYVNKYNMVDNLIATHVKAFITNTANNSNVGRHFRFIVTDASGNIIESSDEITVTAAMENQWVMGEIHNFAITSTNTSLYVGIEMLDGGTYLGVQEEAPLRDTTYYKIENGTITPSTVGRQMINAVLESSMSNELALLSLVHPLTNCDLGHENIVVKMTNNGTSSLQAGTPIYYSVNGGTPVSTTITNTIGSHETVDFTFPAQYNFTNNQVNVDVPYTIKVWVNAIASDRVRFNDTLSVTIQSYGKSPMPTAVSPVHADYHESAILTATDAASATGIAHFWYANTGFESWELQYVGDPFVTPAVYFDTTYYVTSAPAVIQEIQVPAGALNTAAANNITQPFTFTNGFSRGKLLYKASELNANGQLMKISLYVTNAAEGDQGIPIRLYAMNTELNSLSASPVSTWDDEIAEATLIYEGNYVFNTTGWVSFSLPTPMDYEGGNILILTETYCGGSDCATSGSTTYPKFNSASATNCVLYKAVNNSETAYSGNYSTYTKRLVMNFQFVDAECQSEKVPVQVIADNVPVYDVEPVELKYPVTNTCTLLDENIVVKVRNLINNTIPANTVEVKATFNGVTQTQIVNEPFAPNEEKDVTFTNTFDFRAPTADVTFNYTIVTDLIGTPAYRGNDTLTGSFVSKKTAILPDDIEVQGEYLHTYTITRQNTTVNKWYYQDAATMDSVLVQSNPYSFTTPVLYDTALYYVYGVTPGTNCMTRKMRYQIDVATPLHDISTDALLSPLSFQCGVSNPHLQVRVSDTWPNSDTIPANTFKLKANFTGAATTSVEHTISQPVYSVEATDVTFGNTVTLGSATQNNIYNYVIYSNPVNSSMYVYRNNDTITGTLYVPATPATPADISNASAPYGGTATVTPSTATFNQFYFYDQPTGGIAIAQGTTFVTPEIVTDPTYFYYSGRILDPQFAAEQTVGTSNNSNALPFNFAKDHSVGVIMYTPDDLGFSEGIIDTISLYVHTAGSGNVPMKLYLKNDNTFVTNDYPNLTPQLVNQLYQNNWNNLTNGAMLIVDGTFEFDQPGWYSFVVPGGFHYNGNSLLLLTEHHGKNTTLGYSAPTFKSSNAPNVPNSTLNKRVVYASADGDFNPEVGTMSQGSVRFNTKFNISYACESAGRGVITVHTSVPAVDLEVVSITNPVSPNASYTNNETVSVQLANHGSNAATSYSLSYQLEGQAPVSVNNPITIPSGNTVSYSFATTVDLSEIYFPKTFKVYVTCAADEFPSNDTVTIVLTKEICESGAQNAASPDIANVTFAGIDNVPLPSDWTPFETSESNAYTDYTQTVAPAVLVKGQTYPISITNSFTGTSGVKLYKYVFIDFNRDGEFDLSTTNSERVVNVTANTFNSQHPENATSEAYITVPLTAEDGPTLMRVIASTATTVANTGCGYFAQGETEDYQVVIRGSYNQDLAVVGYLQPSGVSCPDARANIKVYVKNVGTNDQALSVSNPMSLTAVVSGTIQGTYTQVFSSGSIAAGETKVFSIPAANFSAVGSYSIVTTLDYMPDEYTINNAWATVFTVGNLTVDSVPHLETFDETITNPESPFTDFWTVQSTSGSYKWDIQNAPADNSPNAGPTTDHTATNNMDQFAIAQGKTNQTSNTATTTLTTKCLNLHYQDGYPIQLDYWEHIYGSGTNTPTGTLLVQIGTGDESTFITVDSVVGPTQSASSSSWKQRMVMLSDNDEVAKVRFKTYHHTRLMDIALDDINFGHGKPDLGIADILYPFDFRNPEGECMIYGDSIHPVVAVVNSGLAPVVSFEITGKLKVGYDVISFTETWEAPVADGEIHYFMPGETIEYTFTNAFEVFATTAFCDFEAIVHIDQDEDPYNNNFTVHPCATVSVDDYVKEGGLVLNQNVPNPADNKTRISFLVPQAGQAVIEIFSLTGQKLYGETINAQFGENYIDINTSSFAAGMYIYTLQFEDAVLTKKMTIQK